MYSIPFSNSSHLPSIICFTFSKSPLPSNFSVPPVPSSHNFFNSLICSSDSFFVFISFNLSLIWLASSFISSNFLSKNSNVSGLMLYSFLFDLSKNKFTTSAIFFLNSSFILYLINGKVFVRILSSLSLVIFICGLVPLELPTHRYAFPESPFAFSQFTCSESIFIFLVSISKFKKNTTRC